MPEGADDSAGWSALLDDAACGLLQTDANGLILRVNRVFCTWVGRSAEELVGLRKVQDLFTIGGRIFHQTHWVPLLQMQQSVSEVKFDVAHSDGHTIPMIVNGIRRMRHGGIVHDLAVFVARDRDMYERELVRTGKRLKELAAQSAQLEEEAKDRALFAEQMIGIVSHDLRNPLATVELSALGVLEGGVTPNQREALARITRATGRAKRLIRDLLDFTQARLGGGIALSVTTVNLHALIAEHVDELRHLYPRSTIVHRTLGEGQCELDPDRLVQILGNLVTNAIAYGASLAPVTVTSVIERDASSLIVHNEGRAIPDSQLPQLFHPMSRGEHGTDGSRSIGLGLYIVREIAKAHGGDVRVTSSVEDGTTFTVEFPERRKAV